MRPFFVLAGPPGAGKSTVLDVLRSEINCVAEPARRVLSAERASGGTGTGDQDQRRFVELMLKMAMADFDTAAGPTVFDRGLPDLLAFCDHYGISKRSVLNAVRNRRYADTVFWFPSWRAIYRKDDERKLDFRGAAQFGKRIRSAYLQSGYRLIDMPTTTPFERARFILNRL